MWAVLIHAGEILDLVIATVSGYASTKSAQGHKRHKNVGTKKQN
jgi:hypothetical protein